MSVRIQELAIPKGIVIPPCEICGKKATTKCEKCRVAHYCSDEHKSIDLQAFHRTVCNLLLEIKEEGPVPLSKAERIEENKSLVNKKMKVFDLAKSNAKQWMLEGNFEFAYPSALIAYNFARELWSADGIESIYPTCLVSEMFLGLKNHKAALEYMSVASWVSQKHDVIPAVTWAQFQRLKGLVFMVMQNWAQARKAFAEFVYTVAHENGTKNVKIALPYGYLGLSLLELNNVDGAMACFHKMADKWLEELLKQYENRTLRSATNVERDNDKAIEELEFQFMESKIALKWIYERIRPLEMNKTSDLINFKILCAQALLQMRANCPKDSVVFKEEALATATRTKMDKAVKKHRFHLLVEILGEDYILRWEKKHNRPRTVATKYLEMIKAINI